MRVLWISPRQCFPPNSGAKLRDYHCAKALGQIAEVTYVHFLDPGANPPSPMDMPFCRAIISVKKPPTYTAWNLVRGLVGRWPLPVLNYFSQEMSTVLKNLREKVNFDIVHFDSMHMASYETPLINSGNSRVLSVYDWHNIESESMQRFSVEVKSVAKRFYANSTVPRLQKLERTLLQNAFAHTVCSKREEMELTSRVPGARVATVPNGVDTAFFARPTVDLGWPPKSIIFVGAMNYYPNVDAALWFARDVWPRVRSLFPECRLTLVGSDPVPEVLALRGTAGIEVTGTVRDVRPFYHHADIALAPLRMGGGTRLKILEAMAAGVPVISTAVGAEGLAVESERNILIADETNPESWVRATLSLGESERHRGKLIASAMQLVRDHYDWTVIGKSLCNTYLDWLGSVQ
jgi:glycosyltransferase involved in cell wall biosynthesis